MAIKANETSREELLLRDVNILFKEVQMLRNENKRLTRQNEANLNELARLSDLVTILQNGSKKAQVLLKMNAANEKDIYIKKIKAIRSIYNLTQKELSKRCFFDITTIENKRSSVEMTKEACMKVEFLHDSGELKRYEEEKKELLW
jgi:DNA-binding transcriptional regulator YiaG